MLEKLKQLDDKKKGYIAIGIMIKLYITALFLISQSHCGDNGFHKFKQKIDSINKIDSIKKSKHLSD